MTRPPMEIWSRGRKAEAIHGERFITQQAARDHVFDYIEIYYNRKRLGYFLPEAFELRRVA